METSSSPPRGSFENLRIESSGPVHRHRGDDRVDARAVGKARIHHGGRLVDAPARLRNDLLDDALQVGVVFELDRSLRQLPGALDVNQVGSRHQDVGDVGVLHQRFERA